MTDSSPNLSDSSSMSPSPSYIQPNWRPNPPKPPPTLDPTNYPTGKKSLSGISLRAFLLGTTLGLSTSLTITLLLLTTPTPLWRLPFFLASLSLFHFLEYYVTAAYNTRYASVSAFLLSSNGWAYNVAHTSAALECLISHWFWPATTNNNNHSDYLTSTSGLKLPVVIGVVLMVIGQTVRTLAMVQAGSNFNHTVQVERKEDHVLVTSGVYALLRHPSYFGFFWWGLGTQLVLGNVVCLAGYAVVLWKFFHSRIIREERFLVAFFGDDYRDYKKKAWIGIPGIKTQ
ncbi:hypothetical protein FE257_010737 [Aspergillus nanangensis]|uniref:Protein-S-isoprenylcysteine O-methyltransferase n=1 Tax=Aspergillus nanangensis TaxID=2582783 RepID=A0AAD4GY59_ASPNN|nr:hypothetical protein FE257_010737 [Aspergillus nanangensis]